MPPKTTPKKNLKSSPSRPPRSLPVGKALESQATGLPWGAHLCQFYRSSDELFEILAPYFQEGLAQNEACVWVTSPPLEPEQAAAALRQRIPEFDRRLSRGQIQIVRQEDWYFRRGRLKAAAEILKAWQAKAAEVGTQGFHGLRISGDTRWLDRESRVGFREYEKTVNESLAGFRIKALCTYPLEALGAADIVDVMSHHQSALVKTDGQWRRLDAALRPGSLPAPVPGPADGASQTREPEDHMLFDLAAVGQAEADPLTGRLVRVNRLMCEKLGYTTQELLDMTFLDITHPDDRERSRDGLGALLRGDIPELSMEKRYLRKDGSVLWGHVAVRVIRNSQGQPLRTLAALNDITEGKKAEEALRKSEGRLRRFIESSLIGVVVGDFQGRLLDANNAFLQMVGYTRDDLAAGRLSWRALTPPEHLHVSDKAIQSMRQSGTAAPYEKEYLRKNGTRVPVLVGLTRLDDEQDKAVGFVLDLSESKREEKDRQFLLEASTVLASSLDYESTLTNVARMAVPYFADWCVVDMRGQDGSIHRLAVVHKDPARLELAAQLRKRYPPDPAAPAGPPAVLRTGRPEIMAEIPDEFLVTAAWDEEHLRVLRGLGLKSYMCVPLTARGRVLGALTFVTEDKGRQYGPTDLSLAQDLARRAATAVDNAGLYQEAQRALEARQKSEENLRLVTDALPVLIAFVDAEQRYRFNNKAYEEWFGVPRQAVYGRHLTDVLGAEAYETIRSHVEKALSGQEVRYEAWVPYRGTGKRYISAAYIPRKGLDGRVEGFVGLVSDLTARKQAEMQVQDLNAELEQKVSDRTKQLTDTIRELESFSYSISHDLRAPLRSIDGFSQAVIDDYGPDLSPDAHGHLQRIRAAAQRMARLIDDLLDLSRLTRKDLSREPVNLSGLAQAVAEELRRRESARQAEITIAPGLSGYGDAALLRAVLQNLLENAWKFTSRRDLARIEFGRLPQTGENIFFVRDNGVGFDMAHAGKLFGPFQRLHDPHEFSGTGIGLATVQRIIQRHGGRVWAEGAVDQGATFYFTIPREISGPTAGRQTIG
jgi:PAS domain S-box-containing protein